MSSEFVNIIVEHPSREREIQTFSKPSIMIGRAAGNDIILTEGEVSRFHALLSIEGGELFVQDAGSRNGIFINGEKVARESLGLGGIFIVGDYRLAVELKVSEEGDGIKVHQAPTVEISTAPELPEMVEKAAEPESKADRRTDDFYWSALQSFLRPVWKYIEKDSVSEIMINGPAEIFIEEKGVMSEVPEKFSADELSAAVLNIAQYVGRRVSEDEPYLDARLPDGSRVAVLLPPCSRKGTSVSIRKFSKEKLTLDKLINFGSLSPEMVTYLKTVVLLKKNIIVSGGTSSGKTSLLNVVSGLIPDDERIITIEDAAELQLRQRHIVPMETKPADKKGRGQVTIRDLVRASLRMRPDRIVVGEIRGGEALDLLQAMNTGHSGSMATVHASSPTQALSRLETLALFSGLEIPARALREQVTSAVEVVIQAARLPDHSRKVTYISEVLPLAADGSYQTRDVFRFERSGLEGKRIIGKHNRVSNTSNFLEEMELAGLEEAIKLFRS